MDSRSSLPLRRKGPILTHQTNPFFSAPNSFKANFGEIYGARDPRAYFQVLGGLGYVIPEMASPIFVELAERLIKLKNQPITILDLGCSYGVLSAVSRQGVTIEQLRNRYSLRSVQSLSSEGLAACDESYFASWPTRADIRFVGLDRSRQAIAYACRVGLLDEGVAVDLETDPLNQRAQSVISKADLIVSTGAVGYISERTFSKVMTVFEGRRPPWIASFVLRMFSYRDIAHVLSQRDLETERFTRSTFVQRRFQNEVEREETLQLLGSKGIDSSSKEAKGFLHADLFVSRPSEDIQEATLDEIMSRINNRERGHDRRDEVGCVRHRSSKCADFPERNGLTI